MTMRITMLVPRRSEDGLSIMTAAGSPYTVSEEFGAYMVSNEFAVDTDAALVVPPSTGAFLTSAERASLLALLAGGAAAPITLSAPDGLSVDDVVTALPAQGWSISARQWVRDDVDISGQTSSTHTIVAADLGTVLGCKVGLGDGTYTAYLEIPAPDVPAGQLYMGSDALYLGTSNLALAA